MKKNRLDIGIHETIDARVYHADPCKSPSLSSSVANILLTRSPLHAWHAHPRLNKNFEPRENERMDIGSAAHAVCLEGDMSRVEKLSFDSFRTNAAKDAREAAREDGKIPLLEADYEKLGEMVKAFRQNINFCVDLNAMILGKGKPEQTLIWRECEGRKNFYMRARPDWLADDHTLIIDYKTVDSAESEAFIRGPIVQHGYDVQAAFYLRGLKALDMSAIFDARYIWILQEIKEPFAVSFVGYGEQMAEVAEQKVARAIEIWKRCLTSKQWSAYGNKVAWANLPSYAVNRWEEWQAMQGFITSSEQLS